MTMHEHLRRLVEAREVDSIRDRKHEFSVLAGIRPNLPSLEEAWTPGKMKGSPVYKAMKAILPKHLAYLKKALPGAKFSVADVDVSASSTGENYYLQFEFELDGEDHDLHLNASSDSYGGEFVSTGATISRYDHQHQSPDLGSEEGIVKYLKQTPPAKIWKGLSPKTIEVWESVEDLGEAGTPASVKKLAAEVDAYSRKLEKQPEEGADRLRELAHLLRKLNKFGGAPTTELVQTRRTLRNMMKDGAIPPAQAKHSAANIRAAMEKFRKQGMAEDLDEALGVPALNKWKMHQKGGTTAYAITLHGKKVIVGETPSPKGSGLYRYSLYIDGAKYGKQDFTSTRDLFQTIQKAVVESADDIEEAARPTFKKAREALLKYLDKEGWDVKTWGPGGALKIPHATHPHQNLKLWFKGQAVYQSGAKGNIKQARSTWVDIRDMSPEEFVQEVEK